jgi:hypothetical protein
MAPSGEWCGRVVMRFARLTHRRGRDLGGPAVRAACGGNLSLPWWPRRVVWQTKGMQPASAVGARRRYLIGDAWRSSAILSWLLEAGYEVWRR